MYAVVSTGGKQLKVEKGAEAVVEKLDAAVGDTVNLDVIFVADGDQITTDAAALSSATVTAEILEHFRDDKVVVFKFKKRKGYKRTKGHRQSLTRVRITDIATTGAKPAAKKAAAEPKAEAETAEDKPKAAAKPKAAPKAKAEATTAEKPKRAAKPKAAAAEAPAEEKPKRTRTKKAAEAETAAAESAESGE